MTDRQARSAELAEAHQALAATRFELAIAQATPVFLAARDAGQWALASEAALLLGRAHSNMPRAAEALRWQNEAAQAARMAGDVEAEALAWLQLAAEHARYEQVAPALQALEEAGRLTVQVREAARLYPLLSNTAAAYYGLGLLNLAVEQSRRALDVAEQSDDLAQRLTARTNLLLVGSTAHEQAVCADPAAAAALLEELRAHVPALLSEEQRVAAPRATARAGFVLARLHMAGGEWEQARDRLTPVLNMKVDLPQVLWCSLWVAYARMLAELGDRAGSRAAALKAEAAAEPPRPGEARTYDLRRRAEIAELLGRPEEALTLYRRLHERAQFLLTHAFEARLLEFHVRLEQQQLVLENSALRQRNHALDAGLQTVSRLAITDPLTGLLNRRGLEAEIEALRRAGQPYVLALADVDHFKRINDVHSHVVGDRVLAVLAGCMAGAMRDGDRLARFGGEEFVILLPGAGLAQATLGLDRLRAEVQSQDWTNIAPGLGVTVSVGLAAADARLEFDTVLARADSHLYQAKQAGRNRVSSDASTSGT